MFQNAGEKGEPHQDPKDPPRRRGNKRRGHGTYANDRPPVVGTLGRESGLVQGYLVLGFLPILAKKSRFGARSDSGEP